MTARMTAGMTAPSPIAILLIDTGNEWGGGTNSMLELLKRADPARLRFRVCLYTDSRKGGGGERLTEALGRLGIEAIVLPPLRQPLWAKLGKEMLRLAFFWSPFWRKRALWQVERRWRIEPRAREIAQLARKLGVDLLYLNNQPSSNAEGYLAARAAGIPVVQHCRIDTDLIPGEVALANESACALICVSHGVLESMARQGIRRELLHCVHNGIDVDSLDRDSPLLPPEEQRRRASSRTFTIGTVGNLMPRKSIDHLLRAAALIKARGEPAPRVLVVGDGAERLPLEALAAQLGLENDVEFLGFLADPLPVVAGMDVFAFCSSKEGFPRVVLEAMALGKPVVSSDVVGPQEAVAHGTTGFLYPHGDVEALAGHLLALRRDPALRERLGAAGRARVAQHFSIQSYVTGVSRILASCAPAPGDGSRR